MRDEQYYEWLAKFEKHKFIWLWLAYSVYVLINNSLNVATVWAEATRHGQPEIALWEPFCWEYSSALASIMVVPICGWIWLKFPLSFAAWRRQLALHCALVMVFSLSHVGIMVLMREAVYAWMGGNYDFGPWWREFGYEFRKDAWGYVSLLFVFQLFMAFYRRLRGEAQVITEQKPVAVLQHFLVKKLDKEFLVRVADIEWLEASANYVNLHSQGRIYPLRGTLNALSDKLAEQGFSRIHRSYAVNHQCIGSIAYQPSGDGELTLTSGQVLPVSRRYKEQFRADLSQ